MADNQDNIWNWRKKDVSVRTPSFSREQKKSSASPLRQWSNILRCNWIHCHINCCENRRKRNHWQTVLKLEGKYSWGINLLLIVTCKMHNSKSYFIEEPNVCFFCVGWSVIDYFKDLVSQWWKVKQFSKAKKVVRCGHSTFILKWFWRTVASNDYMLETNTDDQFPNENFPHGLRISFWRIQSTCNW